MTGYAVFKPDAPDGALVGAYAVDQGQAIRFWNSGARRILGHSGQDVIGQYCHQVLRANPGNGLPPVCQRGCPFIRLAGQGRIPPAFETSLLCASGQRKRVTLAPMIIPSENGGITLVHLFRELPDGESGARGDAARDDWLSALFTGVAAAPNMDASLTGRELEVLRLMSAGLTNHEIAENLAISYHTVRNHVGNVRGKLQAGNRQQAAIIAGKLGLI